MEKKKRALPTGIYENKTSFVVQFSGLYNGFSKKKGGGIIDAKIYMDSAVCTYGVDMVYVYLYGMRCVCFCLNFVYSF